MKKMWFIDYVYITHHKEMALLKGDGDVGSSQLYIFLFAISFPWTGAYSVCLQLGPGGNIKYLSLAIIWLFPTTLETLQQTFLNMFHIFLHPMWIDLNSLWDKSRNRPLIALLDHLIHGKKLPQCKMCELRKVLSLPPCGRKVSWISHFTVLYLCYTIKKCKINVLRFFACALE